MYNLQALGDMIEGSKGLATALNFDLMPSSLFISVFTFLKNIPGD